jgi:hypothetical protein
MLPDQTTASDEKQQRKAAKPSPLGHERQILITCLEQPFKTR